MIFLQTILFFTCYLSHAVAYYSVITIPGFGGTQAFSSGGHHFWLNIYDMAVSHGYYDMFKLDFDHRTNRTIRKMDRNLVFPGWGNTKSSDSLAFYYGYFYSITSKLASLDDFYVNGYTMRSAPYDFRKSPMENAFFVPSLMSLVEETYHLGEAKVYLISHSMGCVYTHYFLNEMTDSWKEKFIAGWIPISGPFGGVFKSYKGNLIGEPLIPFVDPTPTREAIRTFSSTHLLFPTTDAWDKESVFVEIKYTKNYTFYNMQEFFDDIKLDDYYQIYTRNRPIMKTKQGPSAVKINCVISTGVPTHTKIVYQSEADFIAGKEFYFVEGNGDGTVNWESLRVCEKWNNTTMHILNEQSHLNILKAPDLLLIVSHLVNH